MLNTFGLRSVNRETFNMRYHDPLQFPKPIRDIVVTALRIHNGVLNVLGYIPGVSAISGCVRMLTGAAIVLVTLAIGDRNAHIGAIIGRWYDEALLTGVTQVARGALEALVPFGWVANAVLDVIATPFNVMKEVEGSFTCDECMSGGAPGEVRPHQDVNYPFLLSFLHLA